MTTVALGGGAVQTVSLNFLHYDDEKYIYVYRATVREFMPLVDDVNRMAKLAGTGTQTGITVVAPDTAAALVSARLTPKSALRADDTLL